MFRQLLNWRTLLALIAIFIVSGTIWYSSYLATKLEHEERQKVNNFGESLKIKAISQETEVLNFTNRITIENTDIPIIETDENDRPSGLYVNLDSAQVANDSNYLKNKIREFGSSHQPVIVRISDAPAMFNKYYYGDSKLLTEVRYYPLVQLFIVGLFILITILALSSSYRSTQNQVWAGMAKETAHQLGTPVSSLEGWVEILKETHARESFVSEMEKDVKRLRLVSDRFGKIGSTPVLEEKNIIEQVQNMVDYIRKRAGSRVSFHINSHGLAVLPVKISAPLFDWVIENLLKNALDAMEGKGTINVDIQNQPQNVIIDVCDTGKGISPQNIGKVFKPGFTTKKRGWGLGLSLSKRIIEQYHQGSLTVKQSEPGKGTTFRIVLRK